MASCLDYVTTGVLYIWNCYGRCDQNRASRRAKAATSNLRYIIYITCLEIKTFSKVRMHGVQANSRPLIINWIVNITGIPAS